MAQEDIKNRFNNLGMNSEELEETLRKMKQKNRENLQNIKSRVDSLRKENQSLNQHLTNLEFEMNTEMKPEEYMQFALYKAEERVPLFHDITIKEVKELTTLGESTEIIYNEKISEFNRIIKETRQTLEVLLNQVLNENENLSERFKAFMEEHSSFKFLPTKEELQDKKIESFEVEENPLVNSQMKAVKSFEEQVEIIDLKECPEDQKEEQQEYHEEKHSKKPEENYEEYLKENHKKNHIKEFGEKPKESDGNNTNDSVDIEEIFYKALIAPSNIVENEKPEKKKEVVKTTTSNFWDDEIFLEDNFSASDNSLKDTLQDSESIIEDIKLIENINKQEKNREEMVLEKSSKEDMKEENPENIKKEDNLNHKENKTHESKALARDINNLRSKYLIGKITGEDLLDSNDKIIVPKNSVITNEIIEVAEKQGKLPELIVNMTLPEV